MKRGSFGSSSIVSVRTFDVTAMGRGWMANCLVAEVPLRGAAALPHSGTDCGTWGEPNASSAVPERMRSSRLPHTDPETWRRTGRTAGAKLPADPADGRNVEPGNVRRVTLPERNAHVGAVAFAPRVATASTQEAVGDRRVFVRRLPPTRTWIDRAALGALAIVMAVMTMGALVVLPATLDHLRAAALQGVAAAPVAGTARATMRAEAPEAAGVPGYVRASARRDRVHSR